MSISELMRRLDKPLKIQSWVCRVVKAYVKTLYITFKQNVY